jgi:hypothetical protein
MTQLNFNPTRVGALAGNTRGAFPSDLEEGMYR